LGEAGGELLNMMARPVSRGWNPAWLTVAKPWSTQKPSAGSSQAIVVVSPALVVQMAASVAHPV